jgi:hypothetical protein
MSQSTSLVLLPQTTYNGGGTANIYTVTGNAQPAAAYYLGNQDLQTLSYSFTNVTGNLVIEATLVGEPVSEDWFKVYEIEADNNSNTNSTITQYQNITGNFVYIRARIKDFANGVVQFVKLTY